METLTFNESQLCSIYVFFGSEVPNYIFTSQKVAQQPFFFFWSLPFELLSPGLPWLLGIIRVSRDTSSFTFSLILSRGFVWLMWIISGSKTSSYLAIFFPKISWENWFAARIVTLKRRKTFGGLNFLDLHGPILPCWCDISAISWKA